MKLKDKAKKYIRKWITRLTDKKFNEEHGMYWHMHKRSKRACGCALGALEDVLIKDKLAKRVEAAYDDPTVIWESNTNSYDIGHLSGIPDDIINEAENIFEGWACQDSKNVKLDTDGHRIKQSFQDVAKYLKSVLTVKKRSKK